MMTANETQTVGRLVGADVPTDTALAQNSSYGQSGFGVFSVVTQAFRKHSFKIFTMNFGF